MGGFDSNVKLDGVRKLADAHQGLVKPEDAYLENRRNLAQARRMNPRAKSFLSRAWRVDSCCLDLKRRVRMLELKIARSLDRIEAVRTESSEAYEEKRKMYDAVFRQIEAGKEEISKHHAKLDDTMKKIARRTKRSMYCTVTGTQHFDPDLTKPNITEFLKITLSHYTPPKHNSVWEVETECCNSKVEFYRQYFEFMKRRRRNETDAGEPSQKSSDSDGERIQY